MAKSNIENSSELLSETPGLYIRKIEQEDLYIIERPSIGVATSNIRKIDQLCKSVMEQKNDYSDVCLAIASASFGAFISGLTSNISVERVGLYHAVIHVCPIAAVFSFLLFLHIKRVSSQRVVNIAEQIIDILDCPEETLSEIEMTYAAEKKKRQEIYESALSSGALGNSKFVGDE